MIIDCPACGAALMYDPGTGKMKCEACESLFETYELEEDFQARGEKEMLYSSFDEVDDARGTASGISSRPTDSLKFSDNTGKTSSLKLSGTAAAGTGGLKLAGSKTGMDSSEHTINENNVNTPSFNPESDFDHPVYDHTDNYGQPDYNETDAEDDTMECNIYTCTSCGAEVAINNVEASTFCSFCGQPTVVFNRVASQKKPKYIIPFSVTKDRAISLIRERLNKGFYVPDDIKNFEIERVRGIYIPFWLYDIYYHDSQYLKGTVGSGKNSHTYYYFREADCDFTRLTLDASKQLNDETSQRLEPYYTKDLKDFSLEYLSGFYADTYDVNTSQLDQLAIQRAHKYFQEEVNKSIEAHGISVLQCNPDFKIKKTEYAMFPAWFLTFRYENIPYTLLVNGQTEKIIGGVPYDQGKATFSFSILAVVLSLAATFILSAILNSGDEDAMDAVIFLIMVSVGALSYGLNNLKKTKESTRLTSLSDTNSFVKDRGK